MTTTQDTPSMRTVAALERSADALERINARQDAALRERHWLLVDRVNVAATLVGIAEDREGGVETWDNERREPRRDAEDRMAAAEQALDAFQWAHRADIARWEREDVEATQRLTASPSDDPNANRTAVSS